MIATLLKEIKALLGESLPQLGAFLNPGASEDQIKEVESALGHALPDDVTELYRLHDGESGNVGLFFGLSFLSLKEALSHWKSWNAYGLNSDEADADTFSFPPDHVQERNVVRLQFPLGSDGGGNFLGIDMDPAAKGRIGQVINFGRDERHRRVIANNITDLFGFIAHEVKHGNCATTMEGEPFFSLKKPENGHFFDVLAELPLPVSGNPQVTKDAGNSEGIEDWLASLDEPWKKVIADHCKGKLTWESLAAVTMLRFAAMDISQLGPIVKFTGLKELIASASPIEDIAPLAQLQQLKTLYIGKTKVKDITVLGKMESLTVLSLNELKIDDISPLLTAKKLRSLSLEKTEIPGLEIVGQLKALTVLDLSKCNFPSYTPLQNLRNLKEIKLGGANVQDLSWIGALAKLTSLSIYGTQVTDFGPVAQLQKLEHISCDIAAFMVLKDSLPYQVSFAIAGAMTEAQKNVYREYQLQ